MSDLNLSLNISAIDSASSIIRSVGTAIEDVAKGNIAGAATVAGLAVAGVAVASVKMAGDFQAGITSLATGAGELQSNLGMVSDGILNLATETGTSTKQLTDGMYLIESAGYHGADGLSVLKAAAEGAKVGNADLGVTANAVTTVLTDYHMSAGQATQATNALLTTVADGKTHLQDLAGSMGTVLPLASQLGVSFPQVGGAIATMTNAGMDAQRASQDLANSLRALSAPNAAASKSLKEVGLSASEVSDSLSHQGLAATLQMIEDHIGQKFPAGSEQANAALKSIMGGATGLNTALMLSGQNMNAFEGNIASIGKAMNTGGDAVQGWNLVQQDFNFKMQQAQQAVNVLMIRVGSALLPVLGQLVGSVVPIITGFANWITESGALTNAIQAVITGISTFGSWISMAVGFLQRFSGDSQVMMHILEALGVVIAAVLVPAVWSLAVGVITATWPFLAVAAAVAVAVAAFEHFYNSNASFRAFVDGLVHGLQQVGTVIAANFMPTMRMIGDVLQKDVLPAVRSVGSFLVSTFGPVFTTIANVFNGQVRPAITGVLSAIGPALPFFQLLATIVGGILVANFHALISVLGGVITGLAAAFQGIVQALGGVVQIVSGVIQIILGIIGFFVDLCTGNFDKLGSDLATIWGGICGVFQGAWNFVVGIWNAASGFFGGVVGGIQGAFSGLVGFFTGIGNGIWNGIKSGINSIINGINSFIGFINGIHIDIPHVDAGPIQIGGGSISLPHIPTIPLLAQGGNITVGGLALVGENGPELLSLPAGAQVSPLTSSSSQNNAAQTVINLTINVPMRSRNEAQEIARVVMDELSRELRRSGNLVTWTSGGRAS